MFDNNVFYNIVDKMIKSRQKFKLDIKLNNTITMLLIYPK